MPTRSDWTAFEGHHATRRGAAMLKEVRRLTGYKLDISQGGKSGAATSAGTHYREAFDLRTASLNADQCRRVEKAAWTVGFAGWWRRYIWNVWPQHHHLVPRGGDLSSSAAAQVRSADAGRDGLAGNRPYPGIGSYRGRTWESYLKQRDGNKIRISGKLYPDIAYVSLYWLNRARSRGVLSRHTFYVQRWLHKLKFYRAPKDGIWGPVTQKAYDDFRRSLGWTGADVTGAPGWTSLQALAKKFGTAKPIREGR